MLVHFEGFRSCWPTHPTIDLSSDCLFSASARILVSILLTSFTGSLAKISSGSMLAQSASLTVSPACVA